ncbi:MAG: fasciclin domain-containing protein [Anaerolineae bacterium]|nr:fasciclin domain-containing protein [Anaerolineae bacterium]
MQRAFLALLGILLLGLGSFPTTAQGSNIASIIDSRSDLSTLKIFLDAADPSVREMLSGSGNFTIFAPNNVAFQNLSSLLEIPLQDLLQNPDIVTQLLQYHILDGALDADGLSQLSGQVVPTQLLGAFVGIRLDDNGDITINNVVEIETANIAASNGVVHVVNDVLLNRIIAATVDSANLESVITPNPSSTTTTPIPSPTVEVADMTPVGYLRVAHLIPDTDAVDVYIDDRLLFEDVDFRDVSRFVALQSGTYNLALVPTSLSLEDSILDLVDIRVADGEFITISAIGSVTNETLDIAVINEDYSELPDDMSRFTVYNALEDDTAIDVLEDDNVLLENVAGGERSSLDIVVDTYQYSITMSGDSETVIREAMPFSFLGGSYYFVAIIGSVDEAQTIIASVHADEARDLRSEQRLDDNDSQISQDDDEISTANILEVLDERDNFTILIAALQVADEKVINRLGASRLEPVTLLAPTDRAFENLLATAHLSQTDLLDNTRLITDILLYHIVESEILAADFRAAAGTSIITQMPNNQAFFVTVTNNGTILLNSVVQFAEVDIRTSNGVIHAIEDVLLPQSAVNELGL